MQTCSRNDCQICPRKWQYFEADASWGTFGGPNLFWTLKMGPQRLQEAAYKRFVAVKSPGLIHNIVPRCIKVLGLQGRISLLLCKSIFNTRYWCLCSQPMSKLLMPAGWFCLTWPRLGAHEKSSNFKPASKAPDVLILPAWSKLVFFRILVRTFGLRPFAWNRSLGNFRMGAFAWTLSPGIFRLGTFPGGTFA